MGTFSVFPLNQLRETILQNGDESWDLFLGDHTLSLYFLKYFEVLESKVLESK